jgi:4-hydroxy-tetrahydrodipicolinate synthase
VVPELPLIPYVIPGRSGTALAAADLALLHLKQPQRVPAVKEATGDLERMRQDRALAGDGLTILSGDDGLTLAMMRDEKIRAAGVISVMSNVAPRAVASMTSAQRSGRSAEAAAWQEALAPLFAAVGCAVEETRRLPNGQTATVADKYRNPVPVKTMMAGLGFPSGLCRRPLGRMSKTGVEKVRAALTAVYRARPDVLTPINEAFGVNVEKRLNADAVWAALAR